jgi:2-polyprenyl-3-methyl-5-hydroxy-6-metoxy-1,4-benzoquinol methylase
MDQDLAYEGAVVAARADPKLADTVRESFLDEDDITALRHFRASEHWARIRRLMDERDVRPPAQVMDFGGGRGLVAASLASDGFRAVLCEPNPSPVCGFGAAKRLREAASLDFEISGGDVSELGGRGFDAVVCRAVLHHVEPLVPVLEAVRAAMRPGASLICSDEPTIRDRRELGRVRELHPFVQFGVDEHALTKREFEDALGEAGFQDVSIRFPVAWRDYRRFLRPRTPLVAALALYTRYRLRSQLRPRPGEVRSIVAIAG